MDLSFIEGAFGGVNEDEGLWEAFDALDDEGEHSRASCGHWL
jgi:hypothetical protein